MMEVDRIPMRRKRPKTWAATEVSSENAHLSDSTMLAFRCLGPFFLWGTRWAPGKPVIQVITPITHL